MSKGRLETTAYGQGIGLFLEQWKPGHGLGSKLKTEAKIAGFRVSEQALGRCYDYFDERNHQIVGASPQDLQLNKHREDTADEKEWFAISH